MNFDHKREVAVCASLFLCFAPLHVKLHLKQVLESTAVKWKIISRIRHKKICAHSSSNFENVIKVMAVRLMCRVTMETRFHRL